MTQSTSFTSFAQKRVQLSNGCNVSYIDEGPAKAPCIFFVHGLATSARSWAPNIETLKQHFRCIAPDLPGNGHSDKGDQPYGMQYYAACIYDLIRILDLKEVTLCGHSMGGQIAMTMLLNAPEAASKLVLCAPAGFEQFSFLEQQMYRSALGFFDFFTTEEQSLKKSIYSSFFHNPRQADQLIEELLEVLQGYPLHLYRKMLDLCVNSMMNEPVYARLGEIAQPCLVLFGERDALIPNRLIHPVTTRQLALEAISRMPDARLEMLPQCGHFLQWEKAGELNRLVREFLS